MKIEDYAALVFWKSASGDLRDKARACLSEVVNAHVDELVTAFYDAFLHHEEGRAFLSHAVVQERLGRSMAGWLRNLVETDLGGDISRFAAVQSHVGEIHARIKVPNHLVMQGASLLKSRIAARIAERSLDAATATGTLIILDELIDFAIGLMSQAYVSDTQKRAKVDEAFRLFALGQDLNLERETQRTALMEWSQTILFGLLGSQDRSDFRSLASSPFGLWARHRAAMLFHGSPLMAGIEKLIVTIDGECLPAVINSHPRSLDAVTAPQERIEEIKFLLNDLFQASANVESGRDPLTRTLNRRFLPSLLGREIGLAKADDLPLSVALIDIDHFKHINDSFGHSTGDFVLAHVAETLLALVRSSDFVFRYGGEEFLIAFAETGMAEATRIAERICRQFAERPIFSPQGDTVSLTVSIGVAAFEGHPDYEYLIKAADAALYQAKRSGRNCVINAPRRKAA